MNVIVLPPEDPAAVRERAGFSRDASWYTPRRQRPAAFKSLHSQPAEDVRESDGRTRFVDLGGQR